MKNLKFISIVVFSTVFLSMAHSARTAAIASSDIVHIKGVVHAYKASVKHARVVVNCGNRVLETRTDARGNYHVAFRNNGCHRNSSVTVVATLGDYGGTNKIRMQDGVAELSVLLTPTSTLARPALGILFTSALLALGAFIYLRQGEQRK